RDVTQHVVTRGHGPPLHPRDEIVERLFAYGAVEAAVPRPAHGPLHQQVPGARGLNATAIVLLQAEGDAEVGGLVQRHDRSANLAGQLGEGRIRLPRAGAWAGVTRLISRLSVAASSPSPGSMS